MKAPAAGFVTAIDALAVGRSAQLAGAGRRTVDDTVDAAAGVLLERCVGDAVAAGDQLAAVFSRDPARRREACTVLEGAFSVGPEAPPDRGIVLGREDWPGAEDEGAAMRVVGGAWRLPAAAGAGRPGHAPDLRQGP